MVLRRPFSSFLDDLKSEYREALSQPDGTEQRKEIDNKYSNRISVGLFMIFPLVIFILMVICVDTNRKTIITCYDSQGIPFNYVGQTLNGKAHGKGSVSYKADDERESYEGDFKNGMRESESATLLYKNGDKYTGSFIDDKFAVGKYFVSEDSSYYEGAFVDNKPWNGTWYDSQGNVISTVENGLENN